MNCLALNLLVYLQVDNSIDYRIRLIVWKFRLDLNLAFLEIALLLREKIFLDFIRMVNVNFECVCLNILNVHLYRDAYWCAHYHFLAT